MFTVFTKVEAHQLKQHRVILERTRTSARLVNAQIRYLKWEAFLESYWPLWGLLRESLRSWWRVNGWRPSCTTLRRTVTRGLRPDTATRSPAQQITAQFHWHLCDWKRTWLHNVSTFRRKLVFFFYPWDQFFLFSSRDEPKQFIIVTKHLRFEQRAYILRNSGQSLNEAGCQNGSALFIEQTEEFAHLSVCRQDHW